MNWTRILLIAGIVIVVAVVADLIAGYVILRNALKAVENGIIAGRPTSASSVRAAIGAT